MVAGPAGALYAGARSWDLCAANVFRACFEVGRNDSPPETPVSMLAAGAAEHLAGGSSALGLACDQVLLGNLPAMTAQAIGMAP